MLPYCPALLSIQCCCFYWLLCGKIYDDDDDDDDITLLRYFGKYPAMGSAYKRSGTCR